MCTVNTKSGTKAGNYFPKAKGAVFANGRPPKGTHPRQAGAKLARKAEERKL